MYTYIYITCAPCSAADSARKVKFSAISFQSFVLGSCFCGSELLLLLLKSLSTLLHVDSAAAGSDAAPGTETRFISGGSTGSRAVWVLT